MKHLFFILCTAVLGSLVWSSDALAWGPGVHLALGNHLIASLQHLSCGIAAVLSAHPNSFLYGCLSADILVGKGKKLSPTHCHSWDAGLRLLHSVREDALKAYVYGYLTHLAADVIAHNYYVPNMLQLGKGKGKLSHVYIEMQADRNICYNKAELKTIMGNAQKHADKLLIGILQKPRFVFSLKKGLYRSGVALSRKQACGSSLDYLAQKSKDRDFPEYQDEMIALSIQLAVDCLHNLNRSVVMNFDPMGFENLGLVKKSKSLHLKKTRKVRPFFLPALNLMALESAV
ncbi:MAG: zinc dependent phospholipase C family protein [Desulfohalobiaceae bacterium]|nr:zinc dependent phospholipase C family protein [Desulfohalobiaceae bacterium]